MPPREALVPGRFLALVAHLVLLVQLAGTGTPHIEASLPPDYDAQQLQEAERQFWGALGASLALLGVELGGFFSGVSMFHPGQGLLSLGAHGAAAAALGLAALQGCDLGSLWVTFGLCSVPPAVTELLLLLGSVLGCGRRAL